MPFSLHFLQYRRNPYPRSNLNKGTLSARQSMCLHSQEQLCPPWRIRNSNRRIHSRPAAPAFSGIVQHRPALCYSKASNPGFQQRVAPYSAPHSAMWPGYAPLVATSSPCQKPQALQASTPTMAYQQPHKRRDQIGVPMLTFFSVTSTTQ